MILDKDSEELVRIGKIVLYKNALFYGNSVFQISTICSVWVADKSYKVESTIPTKVKVALGLGVLGLLASAGSQIVLVISIGVLVYSVVEFFKHDHRDTSIKEYALGVERSSGRVMLFRSADKKFVQKAARAIAEVMSDNQKLEKIEMNFDSRSITVENASGSNIIGGNVSDSLVESL